MSAPIRGQVYSIDFGDGPEPWVVVSNNVRNRQLREVLGAPIADSTEVDLATVVALHPTDPVAGVVLADEIERLHRHKLITLLGVLSPGTIMKLNRALKIALAIP